MTASRVEVRRGTYHDSVTLMQVSRQAEALPGVEAAAAVAATPVNLELVARQGFTVDTAGLGPSDLVLCVRAADEQAAAEALEQIEALLAGAGRGGAGGGSGSGGGSGVPGVAAPPSLPAAARRDPDLNLAVLSVPGRHLHYEIAAALQAGLHVFCFSDGLDPATEAACKRVAAERGLLLMGPDCGTAIIDGVGLGFANAVRRGPVGIVGASGTGIQEVTCLLDAAGVGISHAIGVGGRDLSPEVGGIMTLHALNLLATDPTTERLVVISKPPDPEVARRVADAAATTGKPAILTFPGMESPPQLPMRVRFARSLEAAATWAAESVRMEEMAPRSGPFEGTQQSRPSVDVHQSHAPVGAQQPDPPVDAHPHPPVGAQQPHSPEGSQQPHSPEGTQQPHPPGGSQHPHPPVGAQQPHPPEGTQQPHPPGGTQQPHPPGGAQQRHQLVGGAPTGRVADRGTSGDRLSTASPEVAMASPEAAAASPEAATASPEAATASPEAATASPQAATASPQAATASPQAATASPQAATASPEPPAASPRLVGPRAADRPSGDPPVVTPGAIRGLFCGGTLCYEAMAVVAEAVGRVASNIPLRPEWRLADPHRSAGHTFVDFGDDAMTEGRAHPMIDPGLRNERFRREAADPETGVVLLDVVLGYGAHPDPAGELAPLIERALADRPGGLSVVVSLCGAAGDPQGLDAQAAALRAAGALVTRSSAHAARLALTAAGLNQAATPPAPPRRPARLPGGLDQMTFRPGPGPGGPGAGLRRPSPAPRPDREGGEQP